MHRLQLSQKPEWRQLEGCNRRQSFPCVTNKH
jgi:hypothetical protein